MAHNLPSTWQVKLLGEVAEIIAGQSPPSSTYNDNQQGLPFFQGKVDFGVTFPKVRVWCNDPVKIAKPKDILISVRAPVGPTNICNVESCIGRGLSAIRSKANTEYKYVFYFLKSIENRISDQGHGSTFNAITQNELRKIKIPLPPLPIQILIAEILEKADKAKQKRKEANKLTDEFLQSVFIEMFGDPVMNPKGWEIKPVISHCKCIVPGRDKPKSFTGNIPWITTDDLVEFGRTSNSNKCLGLTHSEIKEVNARIIPKESVLLTCVGDLGVISIADKDMVINQQLHSFQCKPTLNNVFLMFCLSFQKSFMYRRATSTTVPYMNKTTCNSIPIIFPPIILQQQFAEIVNKTEALKEKQKQSEQELENLFQSLMQKAFKGELVG